MHATNIRPRKQVSFVEPHRRTEFLSSAENLLCFLCTDNDAVTMLAAPYTTPQARKEKRRRVCDAFARPRLPHRARAWRLRFRAPALPPAVTAMPSRQGASAARGSL